MNAVTSGVAIVDVLPIRGTSVKIVVRRDPNDATKLQLVREADLPMDTPPLTSPACGVGQNGRAPSLVVENTTDRNLSVTVLPPTASVDEVKDITAKAKTPEDAKKALDELKTRKCFATCSINPTEYLASLCALGSTRAQCTPKPEVALCNSPECLALRGADCKTPGCSVDLLKVVDSCTCSVSKPLAASIAPQEASQSAAAQPRPAMRLDLTSATIGTLTVDPDEGRRKYGTLQNAAKEAAERTGITITSIQFAKIGSKQQYPVVRFDAAIFSKPSDGLANASETYQIQIADAGGPKSTTAIDSATLDWTIGGTGCLLPSASPLMRVAVVPLDDTGVASWRYLNPRNPACINCDAAGKPLLASDTGPAGVAFRNRTLDRTFSVSFTLPAGTKLTDADEATFQCQAAKDCVISRAVPPQNTMLFDIRLFATFTKSPIRFDVALLGESATLANPRAYLSLGPALDATGKSVLDERPSLQPLKTKLTLAGKIDPDLPAVPAKLSDAPTNFTPCNPAATYDPALEPVLCLNHKYDDKQIQQYTAKGTIQVTPNLGDRADASATLGFRSGTLGTAIDKVGVDEYQVNIYGVNGLSLKFGKTDFAVPSNKIAIAESGEGFLYSYQNFSLGHLLRRESRTGTADFRNRDKKDWWIQLRSMSLGQRWRNDAEAKELRGEKPARPSLLAYFRSFDAIALIGKDKEENSTYRTIGGEVFFARPGTAPEQTTDAATTSVYNIFGGSLAAYRSSRSFRSSANCLRPEANPLLRCRDGRGTVALLSATWTPRIDIKPGKASSTPQAFSVAVGVGSGDKPGTNTDEGYIGESASFAPDKLFLASFIAKMNTDKVTFVSPGLSNKRYIALTYTNNEFSLFDIVAKLLTVDGDVNSRTTIIALRDYHLRYSRNNSRSAAQEAGATFQIEVPKGITFTLDTAYLLRGDAFRDLIPHRGWSIGASVSLSL